MARRRIHSAELVKLLEKASQPLYVLDEELVILYLNEACRTWLGKDADGLLGKKCRYHSGDELAGPDAVAARLCPPPAVLEGREVSAQVANAVDRQIVFRQARFVPLRPLDDEILCIVAFVDSRDADTAEISEKSPAGRAPDIDEALELHQQLQRFRQQMALRFRKGRMVGVTPAMRQAQAQAEVASATRVSVLLLGPKGAGRRHLAETIHYAGHANEPAPFVPLECGLLDVDMIQETLRSVAAKKKEGGTLLLCDADQLSDASQASLAAVLQSPNFPLRVISTAATPLVELPPRGIYREDLAALLSTITIELPPLAKRRDDLPLLAQALLEEQNARGGRQLGGFKPEALDRLCAYAWPGNVDELAQVVSESHAHASGALIARDDLPERLRLAAEAAARPRRKEEPIQLDEFVARIERELIRRALGRAKGNKAKAARLLGLNRPRLYRRMVQLGLAKEGEIEN
jgi:transcriptional regulator with PAS, ATPase and Fis domain